MATKLGIFFILSFAFSLDSFAGSATWKEHPHIPYWNDVSDWDPATIPNGPADVATFGLSFKNDITINVNIEVNGIIFAPTATTAFQIDADGVRLTISGSGITNNSGVMQTFVPFGAGKISFQNSASAGTLTQFIGGGSIEFMDEATAFSGTFATDGTIHFFDNSSAATGTFDCLAPSPFHGLIQFFNTSTAGNATFTVEASTGDDPGSTIEFHDSSTAGAGTFTGASGSSSSSVGRVLFYESATAGTAVLTNEAGDTADSTGAVTQFFDNASAANSVIIASGGLGSSSGGSVWFSDDSIGGTAQMKIFGNGKLDLSEHNLPGVTLGSLEGDGLVFLGANNLAVGSNNLSTSFSGTIQDGATGVGGSLSKTGTGTLTLTGASRYSGGTTISSGILLANNVTGSGTGKRLVQVLAGTLGGGGSVTGPVIVGGGAGSGAFLAPGPRGVTPGTLTIAKKLTLKADATYKVTLDSRILAGDAVKAKGVAIQNGQILFNDLGAAIIPSGTVFTIINNTAATPISGSFSNLADGSTITVGNNTFQANYRGGDGNDLTLTVVPE